MVNYFNNDYNYFVYFYGDLNNYGAVPEISNYSQMEIQMRKLWY